MFNKIKSVTNQLLGRSDAQSNLPQIASTDQNLLITDFNLHDLAKEVLGLFEALAFQKNIELSYRLRPGTAYMLNGNELHIKQVLINLIGNAIKLNQTCVVKLRISTVAEIDARHSTLKFDVIDTGISIPPATIAKLSKSFTEVDKVNTKNTNNTNFSASHTKQLIHQMGGDISVVSQIGIGTVYSFKVPLKKQHTFVDTQAETDEIITSIKKIRIQTVGAGYDQYSILSHWFNDWGVRASHTADIETYFEGLANVNFLRKGRQVVIYSPQAADEDVILFAKKLFKLHSKEAVSLILLAPNISNLNQETLFAVGYSAVLPASLTVEPKLNQLDLLNALYEISSSDLVTAAVVSFQDYYLRKNKANVLIADDSSTNRIILTKILEQVGHTVHAAENGNQALDLLKKNQYDLMILDHKMPILGGIEVIKMHRSLVKTDPRRNGKVVPALILTIDDTQETKNACIKAGATAVMLKPVDPRMLLDAVLNYMNNESAAKQLQQIATKPALPISANISISGS